jgi:NTE family protein
VLDRLLEEDRLTIDGISATSAGSIVVAPTHGLMVEGREGAKDALAHFLKVIVHRDVVEHLPTAFS